MKPQQTYTGGKAGAGTYQKIINHIPKHDVYVEAFVGNGGIFHNLALPALSVINDIDPRIFKHYEKQYAGRKNVVVLNEDYTAVLHQYSRLPRVFFYLDPPYLPTTRKSGDKKLYRFDWCLAQHETFLSAVRSVRNDVMISHYPCALYDQALDGWHTYDFESMTRNGLATERIYMNYATPDVLQDFRYLGTDYRERLRIKRKIGRWMKNLAKMPSQERTGILSAAIAKYGATAAELLFLDPNAENDAAGSRHEKIHTHNENPKI